MPKLLTSSELLDCLKGLATQHGLVLQDAGDATLKGGREAIKAKWFLGGNKTLYIFSCGLNEATRTVTFRESVLDRSWGLAPPGFKMESYSQSGTKVTSSTTQKSVGGGGALDFGDWRELCSQATANAGWQFAHEPMRMP